MSEVGSLARAGAMPARILYPEREERREGFLDRLGVVLEGAALRLAPSLKLGRLSAIPGLVRQHEAAFAAMSDDALRDCARRLSRELRGRTIGRRHAARCFAMIREVADRTVGMRPFDVQLIGGYALFRETVVEMETGEGKTLTATLPAGLAGLAGIPVHIVTVNDYLARRDAETMAPIYRFLGLSVGVVVHGMTHEAKQAAYGCDIVYCTNKELAFDYLRDRMVLAQASGNLRLKFEDLYGDSSRTRRLLLRGLNFAIVDEADSVFIDEARTPLIISGEAEEDGNHAAVAEALALVDDLAEGRDYHVFRGERMVELTEPGKERVRLLTEGLGRFWRGTIVREEMIRQALTAVFLFNRGEHYLVRDGKVQIVDEYTGRIMEDRFWSQGLHQLIEAKEGCELSGQRPTMARITYQRFFRRYKRLAGMTGTAREVSGELWAVFRVPVVRVPTNRPGRRVRHPDRVHASLDEKWRAIAERVRALHGEGRPVLLGTRSVTASEQASAALDALGLPHVVLSAAQDETEAEVVAAAGQRGRITVATNMAGRGTDIKLGDGVAALGGLAVIMSERHDAGRIDRQLAGRAGRQGDPGSAEAILSIEDPLTAFLEESAAYRLVTRLAMIAGPSMRLFALSLAQRKAERLHSRMRRDLMKYDKNLANTLAFSGRPE